MWIGRYCCNAPLVSHTVLQTPAYIAALWNADWPSLCYNTMTNMLMLVLPCSATAPRHVLWHHRLRLQSQNNAIFERRVANVATTSVKPGCSAAAHSYINPDKVSKTAIEPDEKKSSNKELQVVCVYCVIWLSFFNILIAVCIDVHKLRLLMFEVIISNEQVEHCFNVFFSF